MRKLIFILIFKIFIFPTYLESSEIFSVEIKALKLVMEKFNKDSNLIKELNYQNTNYLAVRNDECNATVEVSSKTGLQMKTIGSFDVDVCKKEIIKKVDNKN